MSSAETNAADERDDALVRRTDGAAPEAVAGGRRANRMLTPRAAKRSIERTIRRAAPPDRTVAVAARTAHPPARAAFAVLAVAGVALVTILPVAALEAGYASDGADVEVVIAADVQDALASTGTVEAIEKGKVTAKEAPEPEPVVVAQALTTGPANVVGGYYTTSKSWAVQWPIPFSAPISDRFGYSASRGRMHNGIDILPGYGQPIVAIADGVVQRVEFGGGWGNFVVIEYPALGVSSLYAHMAQTASVSVGERVKAGQRVGSVGTTGWVTAPHLHLEMYRNGAAFDPYAYLKEHAGK